MSSPTPATTNGAAYTAPCPACGDTLTSGIGGYLFMTCGMCQFHGQVMMQPSQPMLSYPVVTLINGKAIGSTGTSSFPGDPSNEQITHTPTDEDRWRDALRRHANELVSSVQGAMRSLTDADWRLPLWQVYERVQEAHGALYRALGERRMGDYPPGRMELDQALTAALLWQVLLLHAAERMREESGR